MNILITGASRGIGYEMARKFASLGNNNVIALARTEEKLNNLKNLCIKQNFKSNLYPIVFDLESSSSYESSLRPKILEQVDHIDILINNAGYLTSKPFSNLLEEDLNRMIDVNLKAPIKLIQFLLPYMKSGGHIVNISSMGGFQGSQKFPGLSVYSSAKAGLICLTECLAEEFCDSGISFNCLAIGATDTEMLREAFPGYDPPFTASDMADFIVDFALNKAKYFNGRVIPVTKSTP